MKRINLIELFVLVIFSEPSVITPMFPCLGSSSSSSSAPKQSEPCIYGLEFLERINSDRNKTWENPRMYIEHSDDANKFKYKLLGANNELAFESTGRDTNLAFFHGTKIKLQAVDNNEEYRLDFEEGKVAISVAESILSADSARYKKCTGSNTYKLETLYTIATGGALTYVGESVCIFKIPGKISTKFVMRRTLPEEDRPLTLCVFRSTEYEIRMPRNGNKRFELGLYWQGDIEQPKYVLGTDTPYKLREFLRRELVIGGKTHSRGLLDPDATCIARGESKQPARR